MADNNRERGGTSSTKVDKKKMSGCFSFNVLSNRANPSQPGPYTHDYKASPYTSQDLEGIEEFPAGATLLSSHEREEGEVLSMVADPSGLLYTGSSSRNIRAWSKGELSGGFQAIKGPNNALLVTQDLVYTASNDGRVRIWVKRKDPNEASSCIYSQTLPSFESSSKDNRSKERQWQEKMRELGKPKCSNWQTFPVTCMVFSEDKKYLYTGSADHSIKVWSLKDWTLVDCLKRHEQTVSAVAAGCDQQMFSGSEDGSVVMWIRLKRKTEKEGQGIYHIVKMNLLSAGPVSVNALFLKSKTTGFATEAGGELYAGLSDGTVLVWKERLYFSVNDVETLRGHEDAVTCLAGSPGTLVFSGSQDGKICAWSNVKGTKEHLIMMTLNAHAGPVNCIAVHEDWEKHDDEEWGCILYSGGQDKRLKTWRIGEY